MDGDTGNDQDGWTRHGKGRARADSWALFAGAGSARWAAVFIAGLNAIAQVWIFPAAPLWALILILLDVMVIYNLTVRWAEPA